MYQLDSVDSEPVVDCSVDNAHDMGVLCATFCKQVYTDGVSKDYLLSSQGIMYFMFCRFRPSKQNLHDGHQRNGPSHKNMAYLQQRRQFYCKSLYKVQTLAPIKSGACL